MEHTVPRSHPRYESLVTREKLVDGFRKGIVAPQGLIAHGRGEMFDYAVGERTKDFALISEKAAVVLMLKAKHPVISVNGNAAILVPEHLIKLSNILGAPLEVNLFHWTEERVKKIANHIESLGGSILCAGDAVLEGIDSSRRIVDKRGIYTADVVLVPLEDGDRCEILRRHGKKVISIDLNPISRTSQMADISIVDNIIRAIPNMVKFSEEIKANADDFNKYETEFEFKFDNRANLRKAVESIAEYLLNLSSREKSDRRPNLL